jgi:DNA-directed RNA polymerase specialized sigma24 family protein
MRTKGTVELPAYAEKIISGEAFRALVQQDDFEDLCQEGRIEVFRNLQALHAAHNPGAFCRTMVRRAIQRWVHREARHQEERVPIFP